jgi:hydrogenase-4 component H
MSIFEILAENLRQGVVTLRYPQRFPPPPQYRGLVQIDHENCVGCASCAQVCVSAAIQLSEDGKTYRWSYEPAKCTFCGRCVDACPTFALQMQADRPPIYHRPGELAATYTMVYPRCEGCGKSFKVATDILRQRSYTEVSPQVESLLRLCPACRQKEAIKLMIEARRIKEAAR